MLSPDLHVQGQLDVLKSADGSALLTDHRTKTQILTAVYGPTNLPESKQLYDKMAVEVLFVKENQPDFLSHAEVENDELLTVKQEVGQEGLEASGAGNDNNGVEGRPKLTTSHPTSMVENEIEKRVKHLIVAIVDLELAPRACLKVHVQVLQNCGGLVSCALNCVVLALIDSGISMKTTPVAVEYRAQEQTETEETEEPAAKRLRGPLDDSCNFVFVFDKSENYKNVIQSYIEGSFDKKSYEAAKNQARNLIDLHGLRLLYLNALKVKLDCEY